MVHKYNLQSKQRWSVADNNETDLSISDINSTELRKSSIKTKAVLTIK